MARHAAPRGEWPLAVSVLVALLGLVMTAVDGWRNGIVVFALGVLLAGVLRLVLSDDAAGLLRVRRRALDVLLMVGLGLAVLVLGLLIPDLPR